MLQINNENHLNNNSSSTVRLTDTIRNNNDLELIQDLDLQREVWEENAYKASNEQLYALLDKCYRYYKLMTENDDSSKKLEDDLELYINMRGFTFLKTTHLITKIVKCVFNAERRITSTYSLVLRAALSEKIKVGDIPSFIKSRGGVHEISISKGKSQPTVNKIAIAKEAMSEVVLAEVFSDVLNAKLDSNKAGKDVVIVATQTSNGGLILKAISYNQTAINTALTAYYTDNKSSILNKVSGQLKASNDEQLNEAIDNAA